MKYLIFIPLFLFSQTPDYPDTLYLKSGKVHVCRITEIDESSIILKYGKDRENTLFLIGVDKIVLKPIGVIYTTESGFNKNLHQLQNIIEERNRKNSFQNSNIAPNTLITHYNNMFLILSNGDAISKFSTQMQAGDSLVISHFGEINLIPIESIIAIRKVAKSDFWKSAGMGILAGAAAGLLIQAPFSAGSGNFNIGPIPGEAVAVGGLAGFLIGGVIGASSGEDEIYDLTYMNPKRKLKKIQEELSKQIAD
jgi:hypothetical protein